MVLFCKWRWYTIYVLHFCGVPPFSCGYYCSFLISMLLVKEQLVFPPRLEVGVLLSPLSDVVFEHPRMCQKCDHFGHNHGVGDCLASCSCKLSPLFQLFNQLGKEFRGVVGPHHLDCVILEVNIVDQPYMEKICCSMVSTVTLLNPVNWSISGDRKTSSTAMTI